MMSSTHVELYEALKPTVGQDAARMIAEVIPPTRDVATKLDVEEVKGLIKDTERSTLRWMLALFIPVWIGTWGTVVALVVKL